MTQLYDESDPVMMHHFIDRIDAGIDNVKRAELCEYLHRVVDQLAESPDTKRLEWLREEFGDDLGGRLPMEGHETLRQCVDRLMEIARVRELPGRGA